MAPKSNEEIYCDECYYQNIIRSGERSYQNQNYCMLMKIILVKYTVGCQFGKKLNVIK